ncbi:hypothetical protein [uncultured Rikenella sp.]|uniref:hypothetical protein n=1 Tax=uncultured Rikenella sp. TaxID=368003 RepID=UPI002607EAF3|nr:hypothetical protein [uncultured Rikenella sp.]
MANFKEDAAREYDWESGGVYVIEPEDPVEGGAEGVSNRQGRELALRTRNLHERLDELKRDTMARADELAEAIDTKDAEALKMAKEYADRIVAELTDSAPEALDTLKELAAALGDDPNFSATVMELIGERVTAEAMAEALEGKLDKAGGIMTGRLITRNDSDAYNGVAIGGENGHGFIWLGNMDGSKTSDKGVISGPFNAALKELDIQCASDKLTTNGNKLWHSGNFDPNTKQNAPVQKWEGDCNDWTDYGRVYFVGQDVAVAKVANAPSRYAFGLIVIPNANVTQLAFDYQGNIFTRVYHWSVGWQPWRAIYHTGNLKATYYAQIDPNGNVVGQVGDWIQSVAWEDDGLGYYCSIKLKVPVNKSTIQLTRITTGGNTFKWYTPVARFYNDSEILVFLHEDNGRNARNYFNISVQGS